MIARNFRRQPARPPASPEYLDGASGPPPPALPVSLVSPVARGPPLFLREVEEVGGAGPLRRRFWRGLLRGSRPGSPVSTPLSESDRLLVCLLSDARQVQLLETGLTGRPPSRESRQMRGTKQPCGHNEPLRPRNRRGGTQSSRLIDRGTLLVSYCTLASSKSARNGLGPIGSLTAQRHAWRRSSSCFSTTEAARAKPAAVVRAQPTTAKPGSQTPQHNDARQDLK